MLQDLLEKVPNEVPFSEIQDFPRMEDRFLGVQQYFGDILGMNIDSVEFCPNHNPPLIQEEVLPWLWVIHPELQDELIKKANDDLRKIILGYNEDAPA